MNVAFAYICQGQAFQFVTFPVGTPLPLPIPCHYRILYQSLHHSEYLSFHISFSNFLFTSPHLHKDKTSSICFSGLLLQRCCNCSQLDDSFLPFSCAVLQPKTFKPSTFLLISHKFLTYFCQSAALF